MARAVVFPPIGRVGAGRFGIMGAEMRWAEFETAAPELATQARGVLTRYGFVLVGTIRRDGTPRISPIEAHLVEGRLMLVMIAGSRKAGDVAHEVRGARGAAIAGL